MRNAFTVLLLATMLVVGTATAFAQSNPPLNGTYKTEDLDFLEGRYSVSWPAGNGYEDLGNLIQQESWNGVALGTEWRIYCPFIANVIQLYNVPTGPGTYIAGYQITYTGGTVWLDGAGPWGGGDPSYTGMITLYSEIRSIQVVSGTLTALNSNHNLEALVVNYPMDCMQFAIGNTAWIGDTPQHGAKPADYPAFLDDACDPNGTAGHWGTSTDLTLIVEGCLVGTEEATWGAVKARYR
jgi:hypothetical protein